jgi:hypothetical protein
MAMADEPAPKPTDPCGSRQEGERKGHRGKWVVKSTGGMENCYFELEEDFKLDSNFTIFLSQGQRKDKLKKAGASKTPTALLKQDDPGHRNRDPVRTKETTNRRDRGQSDQDHRNEKVNDQGSGPTIFRNWPASDDPL